VQRKILGAFFVVLIFDALLLQPWRAHAAPQQAASLIQVFRV
jgi:hypothetical protein